MDVLALQPDGSRDPATVAEVSPRRWYANMTAQVLFAIALGTLVGWLYPGIATSLKPLADVFVRMIKMVIGPIVFLTVVTGISGMGDLKKVGRLGCKTVVYFEVVTTIALAIGLVVVNVIRPGVGLVPPATGPQAAAKVGALAEKHSIVDSLVNIVPDNAISAFVKLDVLQILFFAILFGVALIAAGEKGKPVEDLFERLSGLLFGIVAIVIKIAPIAAFGAMAFTVGTFGIGALSSLALLIVSVYLTLIAFVAAILGAIAKFYGFNIFRFLLYIKDEILICLGTSASESVLPRLMEKLQRFGCSKSVVGLVLPTGYSMNQDGTSVYLSMGAIFLAQVYGVQLTVWHQLTLLAFMMFTSKGVGGVSGAGFVILASTITATGLVPVEGLALLLGIDRFMSEARAVGNLIGNAVATVVLAKSEGEFDEQKAVSEYRLHFENPAISRL